MLAEMLVSISDELLTVGRSRVREADSPEEALRALVDWHVTFALVCEPRDHSRVERQTEDRRAAAGSRVWNSKTCRSVRCSSRRVPVSSTVFWRQRWVRESIAVDTLGASRHAFHGIPRRIPIVFTRSLPSLPETAPVIRARRPTLAPRATQSESPPALAFRRLPG